MTTQREFLEAFWRGDGDHRFICHSRVADRKFRQLSTSSIGMALKEIDKVSPDSDVWFSVATFVGTQRLATQSVSVNALFLDLDCGEGKDYPTKKDALSALVAFKNEYGLPRPCLIDSGNGIHVYWFSGWPLGLDTWRGYAERLKAACKSFGLKSDHKVTTDAARILRVPLTRNFKDGMNPKDVTFLYWSSNQYDLGDLVESLPELPKSSPSFFDQKPDYIGGVKEWQKGHNYMPPGDASMIADKCAAMALVRDTKGKVVEPHWYAALQILNHCADGETIAQDWSSGHEQYDSNDVRSRLQRLTDGEIGPTLCTTFEDAAPDACAGCSFRSKISSPIRLGRQLTPLAETGDVAADIDVAVASSQYQGRVEGMDEAGTSDEGTEAELPSYEQVGDQGRENVHVPQGWRVGEEGVWFYGYAGEDEPKQAIRIPMFLDNVGRLGYTSAEAVVRWRTPMGTWRKAQLPLYYLGDKKTFTTWMLNNAITQFVSIEKVMTYLRDFANQLATESDPDLIAQRFGWNEDGGFFWGHKEITKTSVDSVRVAEEVPSKMKKMLVSRGDKQKWIDATEIFNEERYWAHAFALLASMASPIIKLAKWQGAVLSLAGDSGTGKTTSSQFGLSVFGQPNGLTLSPQDTENAMTGMFNYANNLPLAIDDVSGKYTSKLPNLIYQAANGYAKGAMNQKRQIREAGTWCFCLTITTNNPIMDMSADKLGEAQRRRTLELYFKERLETEHAERLHKVMQENYGVIAEDLLSAYARNADKIRDRAHAQADSLSSGGIDSANRFGIWLLAASEVAGSIASSLGLIKFDYMRVINMVEKQLRSSSKSIKLPEEIAEECIAEFIAFNHGRFSKHNGSEYTNLAAMEMKSIIGRNQTNENIRYIPTATLKSWFDQKGVPISALKAWRKECEPKGYSNNMMIVPSSKQQRCVVVPYDPDDGGIPPKPEPAQPNIF